MESWPPSHLVLPASLRERMKPNDTWLAEEVARSTTSFTEPSTWNNALNQARVMSELRIVVLGTSPTTGCGACDFKPLSGLNVSATAGSPLAHSNECRTAQGSCIRSLSWAVQLQKMIQRRLHELAVGRLDLQVSSMNAVGPGFFASCTNRHVPPNTHVVLLELATNLFDEKLPSLLRRIRMAAPQAAIAMIMWPAQRQAMLARKWKWSTVTDSWTNSSQIYRDAMAGPADLLRVHLLLARLPTYDAVTNPTKSPALFYALGGRDKAHPNALGHFVLARITSVFVVAQLTRPAHAPCSACAWPAKPTDEGEDDDAGSGSFEKCYDHRLPLAHNGNRSGWQLMDDGKLNNKGVAKMGWRSYRAGDTLKLGPIPGPRNRTCALLTIDLGYLLAMRPEQGSLYLACSGCRCAQDEGPRAINNPFPRVVTNAAMTPIRYFRQNVTVTTTTSFHTLWHSDQPCYIHATHVASRRAATSVVRISTMFLGQIEELKWAKHVTSMPRKYPHSTRLFSAWKACMNSSH